MEHVAKNIIGELQNKAQWGFFNKAFFLILFICLGKFLFAQKSNDLNNISRIDSLVHTNLDLNEMDYITYSVSSDIIVVSRSKCIYYLNMQKGLVLQEKVAEISVDSFFNKSNIKTGKQFSDDDYSASCISSNVYLSINIDDNKVFQFNLPFMLLCSDKKINYPFDIEALKALHSLLLSYAAPSNE